MARIQKIPDTWTLEIHVIVLKDSRQTEHEEIGCMNTTKQSSAYSNIKRGGRGAQKERNARNKSDKTKNEKKEMSRGRKDQTFQPSWPNGEYLWISSETRKELISRPKDDDEILLIRITRCKSIIRHARRPYDYDAILLIRIIRCKSIIRHAKIAKKTHTHQEVNKKD